MAIGRIEERILKRIALDYDMQYVWNSTLSPVVDGERVPETIIAAPGEGLHIYVVFLMFQSDAGITNWTDITDSDGTSILGRWYQNHDSDINGVWTFATPIMLPENAALCRLDQWATSAEHVIHIQYFVGPTRFDN